MPSRIARSVILTPSGVMPSVFDSAQKAAGVVDQEIPDAVIEDTALSEPRDKSGEDIIQPRTATVTHPVGGSAQVVAQQDPPAVTGVHHLPDKGDARAVGAVLALARTIVPKEDPRAGECGVYLKVQVAVHVAEADPMRGHALLTEVRHLLRAHGAGRGVRDDRGARVAVSGGGDAQEFAAGLIEHVVLGACLDHGGPDAGPADAYRDLPHGPANSLGLVQFVDPPPHVPGSVEPCRHQNVNLRHLLGNAPYGRDVPAEVRRRHLDERPPAGAGPAREFLRRFLFIAQGEVRGEWGGPG